MSPTHSNIHELEKPTVRLTAATRITPAILLTLSLLACGGDETDPGEDHTPASAALFVDGVDATGLTLTAGQTVRAEVQFYDDQDEEIPDLETDHHTSLVFTPSALASTQAVEDQNFQKDVTAGIAGAGTYTIGYGHDEAAEELVFGPYTVTVQARSGPPPQLLQAAPSSSNR